MSSANNHDEPITENEQEEEVAQGQEPEAKREPKEVTITDIELEALQQEAGEYKDRYWRLLADMENLRKRMIKERDEHAKYVVGNIVCDFLHPLDNLENALEYAQDMTDEVKNWAVGFEMILTQFKDVFSQHGITTMNSQGTAFDPHLHEAIEAIETHEHPPGTVVEELVKGYKMGERTIRPARVKVAKHPKPESTSEESATTGSEED